MQHRVKWKWGRVKRKRIWEEGVSAVFFVWPLHTVPRISFTNIATKQQLQEDHLRRVEMVNPSSYFRAELISRPYSSSSLCGLDPPSPSFSSCRSKLSHPVLPFPPFPPPPLDPTFHQMRGDRGIDFFSRSAAVDHAISFPLCYSTFSSKRKKELLSNSLLPSPFCAPRCAPLAPLPPPTQLDFVHAGKMVVVGSREGVRGEGCICHCLGGGGRRSAEKRERKSSSSSSSSPLFPPLVK